jgi:hypothetical protein
VFLFPSGIGITRNERRFALSQEAPVIERLWGNAEWRDLPIMKAYAAKKLTDNDLERFAESYATAFSKRIDTRADAENRTGARLFSNSRTDWRE